MPELFLHSTQILVFRIQLHSIRMPEGMYRKLIGAYYKDKGTDSRAHS
jgi:hypothetical protein